MRFRGYCHRDGYAWERGINGRGHYLRRETMPYSEYIRKYPQMEGGDVTPLWSDYVESRVRRFFSMTPRGDMQVHNLPKTVKHCTRCVMTNQRPRIVFDDEGVCSACRYAEKKRTGIDWAKRADELKALLGRHRKPSGYDVIVPCSGGKDSSTVAWRLKHELGMNPLCVKWAPFVYTEVGRQNMDALVQAGFDVMEMTPNGILHRRLARLAFEYLGDHFQPFVFGQLAYPMHMAARLGVNLVFGAENGEATYGGDTAADERHCWDYAEWDRIYLKGAGVRRLIEIGRAVGAFTDADVRALSPFYSLPPREELESVEYHWLAHYLPHHPQGNYFFAAEHTGFTPNPGRNVGTYSRYASIDDATDDWHYYLSWVKFGIGRATSDAAHEVRDGDLERYEALSLVKKYDGEFPPPEKYALFKDYIGIDDEQFRRVIERFRGTQASSHRAA